MLQLWNRLRILLRQSTALTLFLTAFVSYAYFYQGTGQNEAARLDSIRAFLESGNLIIDRFVFNSADVIMKDGHYYSGKAPGTFFLGLVPFAVTERVLANFGVEEDFRYHWACYSANLVSSSLLGAFIVVLIFWLGLRFGVPSAHAATVALVIGFGTMLFPFSTLFFSHTSSAFCFTFAFYQLFAWQQQSEKHHWRLWTAGGALGFSITLEYPSAIGVGLIMVYALVIFLRDRQTWIAQVLRLNCGVFFGVVPLFLYNYLAFRQPLYITYEAYAQGSSETFAAHKQGVLGIRVPLWDWSAWPQFFSNLAEITYKPLRGLFFNNPVLVLIFVGFTLILRQKSSPKNLRRPEAYLAVLVFLSYLSFNACFGDSITYWGGGASFGPRYLIVTMPFLALPLFACMRVQWTRIALVCLALLSTFICLMATAVEPRTPYFPANPLFGFYIPRFMNGVLAINSSGVFSNTPINGGSVAFNLGSLMDLPVQFQLTPLYLFWLWMMWHLDRLTQKPARSPGFLFAVGVLVMISAWLPFAALL
jgi:hypothetical protein